MLPGQFSWGRRRMPKKVLEHHAGHQKPSTHSRGRDLAGTDEVVRTPARDPKEIAGFLHGVGEALQHRHPWLQCLGPPHAEAGQRGSGSSACACTFPLTFPLTFPRAEFSDFSRGPDIGTTASDMGSCWDQSAEAWVKAGQARAEWGMGLGKLGSRSSRRWDVPLPGSPSALPAGRQRTT